MFTVTQEEDQSSILPSNLTPLSVFQHPSLLKVARILKRILLRNSFSKLNITKLYQKFAFRGNESFVTTFFQLKLFFKEKWNIQMRSGKKERNKWINKERKKQRKGEVRKGQRTKEIGGLRKNLRNFVEGWGLRWAAVKAGENGSNRWVGKVADHPQSVRMRV